MRLAGTVEEFNSTSFKAGLATVLKLRVEDITLSVEAASIHVHAKMVTTNPAVADTIVERLREPSVATTLSTATGVQVEMIAEPTVQEVLVVLSSAPSAPPTTSSISGLGEDDAGFGAGAGTMAGVLLGTCCIIALLVMSRRYMLQRAAGVAYQVGEPGGLKKLSISVPSSRSWGEGLPRIPRIGLPRLQGWRISRVSPMPRGAGVSTWRTPSSSQLSVQRTPSGRFASLSRWGSWSASRRSFGESNWDRGWNGNASNRTSEPDASEAPEGKFSTPIGPSETAKFRRPARATQAAVRLSAASFTTPAGPAPAPEPSSGADPQSEDPTAMYSVPATPAIPQTDSSSGAASQSVLNAACATPPSNLIGTPEGATSEASLSAAAPSPATTTLPMFRSPSASQLRSVRVAPLPPLPPLPEAPTAATGAGALTPGMAYVPRYRIAPKKKTDSPSNRCYWSSESTVQYEFEDDD